MTVALAAPVPSGLFVVAASPILDAWAPCSALCTPPTDAELVACHLVLALVEALEALILGNLVEHCGTLTVKSA
jgi:hypothetical protein